MELLEKYRSEIAADLYIDDFNIKEAQLKLPSRKHFWVARLIDAKIAQKELIRKKIKLKELLIAKIRDESPVSLSNPTIEKLVSDREEMQKINNKIDEYDILILYLEKVEKIFSTLHWEIKNIIDINKAEQM